MVTFSLQLAASARRRYDKESRLTEHDRKTSNNCQFFFCQITFYWSKKAFRALNSQNSLNNPLNLLHFSLFAILHTSLGLTKVHLISKCLTSFWVSSNSSKKRTKTIVDLSWGIIVVEFFRSFFGRILGYQKNL